MITINQGRFDMNKKILLTVIVFALSACSSTNYCANKSDDFKAPVKMSKEEPAKVATTKVEAIRQELVGTGIEVSSEPQAVIGTKAGTTFVPAPVAAGTVYLTAPANLTFDTNSSKIKPEFANSLDKVAKIANENIDDKIMIAGHTDNTGPVALNNKLSVARAESVAQYLKSKGVDSSRISTTGKGSGYPVATNYSVEGREKNRRVEIALEKKSK